MIQGGLISEPWTLHASNWKDFCSCHSRLVSLFCLNLHLGGLKGQRGTSHSVTMWSPKGHSRDEKKDQTLMTHLSLGTQPYLGVALLWDFSVTGPVSFLLFLSSFK